MTYLKEVLEDDDGELMIEMTVRELAQMGWDEYILLQWLIEEEECQE